MKTKLWKWVTVLDKLTCEYCKEQNGKILTAEDLKNICPPLHGQEYHDAGCRCVLEPYTPKPK